MDYAKQREKRLHIRLDEWGEHHARPDHALGYKPRSVEASIREDGRSRAVKHRQPMREAVFADGDGDRDVVTVPAQPARCVETRNIRPRVSNYPGISKRVREVNMAYHDMRNPDWQRALRIRYIQGYTGKQAAAAFGAPVSAFYSALRDAHNFLLGWLQIA